MDRIADISNLALSLPTTPNNGLPDALSRRFEYLRLSLTDICNFRYTYCAADGCREAKGGRPMAWCWRTEDGTVPTEPVSV